MEIVIATGNPGKLREYRRLFADLPITWLSLSVVGLGDMDVEENGETFQDNAKIKARTYAQASGRYVLADDSGLCVDALDGAPGVYSARYGGPGLDDAGRRQALLQALAEIPDPQRTAHFACVIAVASPENETYYTTEGTCEGKITHADANGQEGFGYDAIFMPDGYDQTFAQLSKETKNRLSHRGEAAQKLVPILEKLLQNS